MAHLLILSWKGIARSDVMEGHYYFIPIHRTGSRVSARHGCEAPARSAASTNAMAAACPRQPTPPRGPASAPRTVPTLVLSSREAAREVMKTHDMSFATRQVSATMGAFTDGGRDIIFAPYGERWRQLRKIAITELLSARRVLSFRGVREAEVAAMLRAVAVAAAAGERPVQMCAP
jgi:cytochrome P450